MAQRCCKYLIPSQWIRSQRDSERESDLSKVTQLTRGRARMVGPVLLPWATPLGVPMMRPVALAKSPALRSSGKGPSGAFQARALPELWGPGRGHQVGEERSNHLHLTAKVKARGERKGQFRRVQLQLRCGHSSQAWTLPLGLSSAPETGHPGWRLTSPTSSAEQTRVPGRTQGPAW